jgi:flavin-binding protein dodecin
MVHAEGPGDNTTDDTTATQRRSMAVVKIIELIGTSSKSSDDAVQQALKEARSSLRNIKAVDLVSTGLRGDDLTEWRAHVRVAFLIERVSE